MPNGELSNFLSGDVSGKFVSGILSLPITCGISGVNKTIIG